MMSFMSMRLVAFSLSAVGFSSQVSGDVPFCRGDANGDEQVDVSDAVFVLLYLFEGSATLRCLDSADVNDDGDLDVADAVYHLGYLFTGGPAPRLPFPDMGTDPTDQDQLDCASYPGGMDVDSVQISILFANYAGGPSDADWGFSCLLDVGENQIMIDTGKDSAVFISNMEALNIDAQTVDALLISHEHGDHWAGTSAFLDRNAELPVYLPLSFRTSGSVAPLRDACTSHGVTPTYVSDPLMICEHVYSSGEVNSSPKEQNVFVRTAHGLIVITPCAHHYITDLVEDAIAQHGDEVYLVLGGYHLFRKSATEVETVINRFRALGVKKVAPCHCSGAQTRDMFQEEYGADYIDIRVGHQYTIGGG